MAHGVSDSPVSSHPLQDGLNALHFAAPSNSVHIAEYLIGDLHLRELGQRGQVCRPALPGQFLFSPCARPLRSTQVGTAGCDHVEDRKYWRSRSLSYSLLLARVWTVSTWDGGAGGGEAEGGGEGNARAHSIGRLPFFDIGN